MEQFGLAKASLQIKNASGSSRSYLVTISMNDAAGNRIAELNGAANAVAAGQTATVDAIGSAPSGAKEGDAPCKVADVKSF